MKDFSFDRKEDEFLSSKNSRQSPEKPYNKFIDKNQEKGNDSGDSDQ